MLKAASDLQNPWSRCDVYEVRKSSNLAGEYFLPADPNTVTFLRLIEAMDFHINLVPSKKSKSPLRQ